MKYQKIPTGLRKRVYERDKYTCQLCARKVVLTRHIRTEADYQLEASLDHIKARTKGGETTYDNLRTLCRSCNSTKRNGTDEDAKFLSLTNGEFTRIHNSILLALARSKLNSEESRLLFAIIAKTYGYSKTTDWIANSQLEEITGIHRTHCSRGVSRLVRRGIVTKTGNMLKFNKYFFQWQELPNQATNNLLPKQARTVTNFGKPVLPELATTKESLTKEILQNGKVCANCNGSGKERFGKTEVPCGLCK